MNLETLYEYSPTTGTLTSVTDPEGGVVRYEYDLYGKVTKLTDQNNNSTTYEYDFAGRLVKETNPLGQSTEYTYEDGSGCGSCGGSAGTLKSKKDPNGLITRYLYDSSERIVAIEYLAQDGVTVENTVEYTYDQYGRKTEVFDDRLPIGDFPTQTFSYEYDDFDRVIKETYPDGEEITWEYDEHGRRIEMRDPDNNATTYDYNNSPTNKSLYEITHPVAGGMFYPLYWGDSGKIRIKQNYSDPFVGFLRHEDNFYYHHQGSIGQIWSSYGFWGNWMLNRNYYIDNNYRITQVDYFSNPVGGPGHTPHFSKYYDYDNTGHLVKEEKKSAPSYTLDYKYEYEYDLAGNRIEQTIVQPSIVLITDYVYNSFNQLVSKTRSPFSENYSYDLNGNQTTMTLSGFPRSIRKHNRENRLVENHNIESGPNISYYIYDHLGRLLLKTDAFGKKSKYYYDGINTLLAKEKPTGGTCWRTKTVYALEPGSIGHVMATRDYTYTGASCTPSGQNDLFYKYDHVGNVIATLDYYGNLVNSIDMEAFGTVRSGGQTGIRLTTKEYHPEAELYYFNQRWYDKNSGIFTTVAGVSPHIESPYLFNEGNPVLSVDPEGEFGVFGCAIGGATKGVGYFLKTKYSGQPSKGRCRHLAEGSCESLAGCISGGIAGGAAGRLWKMVKAAKGAKWGAAIGYGGAAAGASGAFWACKQPCESIADSVCNGIESYGKAKDGLGGINDRYKDHGIY